MVNLVKELSKRIKITYCKKKKKWECRFYITSSYLINIDVSGAKNRKEAETITNKWLRDEAEIEWH